MKIGILIDRLNVGGVEKIAIEEVIALRKLHIDASLTVLSRKAVVTNPFKDLLQGVPIDYLEDRLPKFLKFSFKIPYFYFFSLFHITYPIFLPFFIKKNEYDYIISHNSYTTFTALALSKWKKIPYAMYVWDPISYIIKKAYGSGPIAFFHNFLLLIAGYFDRMLANNSIAVITASKLHGDFLKSIILDKKKVFLLSPGQKYIKNLPTQQKDYLITVSAWKEGKKLEELLEIISRIPKARFMIAGRWLHKSYKTQIEQTIRKLGIIKRVEISGEVSEMVLQHLYTNAQALVIMNNERGFGMPVLEAAACGCPSIITDDTGAAAYFKNGADGLFVPLGDSKAIQQAIEKLLNDKKLAFSMGKHAWETVKEKYSWENHARKLIEIVGISIPRNNV
jgi:glycosyltransferase involved in cell wall biosynthesis